MSFSKSSRVVHVFLSYFFIFLIVLKILFSKKNKIYVFDIDNTVCDTWKSLPRLSSKKSDYITDEKIRVSNLQIFRGMQKHIKSIYKNNDNYVMYLSLRPIFLWISTMNYLKRHNILDSLSNLVLVNQIDDKFTVINLLSKLTRAKIIFYDDLSYNHEYGKVLYYDTLIKKLEKLDIAYYGYDEILKIQQGEND